MKIASYIGTQSGYAGWGDRIVRWRYGGGSASLPEPSHTEIVFEPGDGVDHLMPDGTTEVIGEEYWCASSSMFDRMPMWSPIRAGKLGGVRFKRIHLSAEKWEVRDFKRDALMAAMWYKAHEGQPYNVAQLLVYLEWFMAIVVRNTTQKWTCTSSVAAALGYYRPELYHPSIMRSMVM